MWVPVKTGEQKNHIPPCLFWGVIVCFNDSYLKGELSHDKENILIYEQAFELKLLCLPKQWYQSNITTEKHAIFKIIS